MLEYYLAINDSSIYNPFTINKELVSIAEQYKQISNGHDKAFQLFEWFKKNIHYKDEKFYKRSTEVLRKKHGVCAESTVLYVTMARCSGLKANYVSVHKDNTGKKVCHACAGVKLKDWLLVDIAQETFDIKHKKYQILTDEEVFLRFKAWNS
ncbi:MAG: transglutaminase-like domain-containing protein [Nanoarchaeota archaeon]|nr:transglutaminase-like domain-containing protein [Nanoarchaeota archaeon]MBU4352559.1 transglutaminase-like domain-containing protein [Nanoarchaeota archaeon]MBU4456336.1 transglutaminase-like domain-containing protein [Nanoarchaeota archaeon]MCG2719182.1 transglutaminase-like domain-containing protein [Nanoarchaeota archaeon]